MTKAFKNLQQVSNAAEHSVGVSIFQTAVIITMPIEANPAGIVGDYLFEIVLL